MTPPAYAVHIWADRDGSTLWVLLPNGEKLGFPAREPGRLSAYLQARSGVGLARQRDITGAWEAAVRRKGEEIRQHETDKRIREAERKDKKLANARKKREAEAILADVGL